MIKIKIGNAGRETDIRFPISESDPYNKLEAIHAIDSMDEQQPVTVTGIYWPEEFSVLEGRQVNLDGFLLGFQCRMILPSRISSTYLLIWTTSRW